MCGIGGIFSLKPRPAAEWREKCMLMSAKMKHRGPDDEGFVLFTPDGRAEAFLGDDSMPVPGLRHISEAAGNFSGALVHRRLSIVGLGLGGHQPVAAADKQHWLVYNGETFNFKDLDQLFGFENQSGTDTETVLKLLSSKGADTVEQLDGFYALGLYEDSSGLLRLRRDKTGVKPLYYAVNDEQFAFCSEPAALRKLFGMKELNAQAVFHLLAEGVFVPGLPLVDGIYEVQEGLDVNTRTLQMEWWFGADVEGKPEKTLRDELEQSVKRRLMADVPLGFALSGGLDSAGIVGLARKSLGPEAEMKLFSVVSGNPAADESAWQKQVADFNGAQWFKLNMDEVGMGSLLDVAARSDLPAVGWNNVAHFELCRLAASQGVKVFFNGQGADELFGGYPDYLARDFMRLWPFVLKHVKTLPLNFAEALKMYLKLKAQSWVPGLQIFYAKNAENNILNKDYKQFTPFLWQIAHLGADAKMQHDYFAQKLRQMLMWDDRNGMVHSLESRNPFADDMSLARWLNVPFKEKLQGGFTKSPLRHALKGVVPEPVRMRSDKRGFSVPDSDLTRLHRNELEPYFMSSVLDDFSPRPKRDQLLKKLNLQDGKQLRTYFRFSAFAAWLTHLHNE